MRFRNYLLQFSLIFCFPKNFAFLGHHKSKMSQNKTLKANVKKEASLRCEVYYWKRALKNKTNQP